MCRRPRSCRSCEPVSFMLCGQSGGQERTLSLFPQPNYCLPVLALLPFHLVPLTPMIKYLHNKVKKKKKTLSFVCVFTISVGKGRRMDRQVDRQIICDGAPSTFVLHVCYLLLGIYTESHHGCHDENVITTRYHSKYSISTNTCWSHALVPLNPSHTNTVPSLAGTKSPLPLVSQKLFLHLQNK